jgi:hypothetical protein
MLIRISTAAIARKSKRCKEGFFDSVMRLGTLDDQQRYWTFSQGNWDELNRQHCRESWITAPIRAAKTIGEWIAEGAPTDPDQAAKRRDICLACTHWLPELFPHCDLCKCSAAKWHIPTAKCLDGKW